jgi:hypothetical protein
MAESAGKTQRTTMDRRRVSFRFMAQKGFTTESTEETEYGFMSLRKDGVEPLRGTEEH